MSGDTESLAPDATSRSSKFGTCFVVGSLLFMVGMLFYMERVPAALHWPVRILFLAAIGYLVFALFQKIRATRFEAKKVVFSLILILFLYGCLYVVCAVFVKLMAAKDEALVTSSASSLSDRAREGVKAMMEGDSPSIYDVDIGWVHRPNYSWKMHSIGPQGLRGQREYAIPAPDPEKRILCVGDSFTFGYEVDDDQTFPYHGEQMLPGTEWVNLGICGGGLAQSYLHYKKSGTRFGGKYVVIAFMTNNNKRTVNCFRAFISPDDTMTPLTKPFAKLTDGKLTFEPNPYQDIAQYETLLTNEEEELRKLYETDYYTWSNQKRITNPVLRTLGYVWERRDGDLNLALLLNQGASNEYGRFDPQGDPYGKALWHPRSPGFRANAMVFDQYYKEVIADGREPLIVILPSAKDVETRAKGKAPKHEALLSYLDEKGYRYFDFLDKLEEAYGKKNLDPKKLYVNTHFNGDSNKLLAEEIIKALELQ